MIRITKEEIAATITSIDLRINDGEVFKDSVYQEAAENLLLLIREREIEALEKEKK